MNTPAYHDPKYSLDHGGRYDIEARRADLMASGMSEDDAWSQAAKDNSAAFDYWENSHATGLPQADDLSDGALRKLAEAADVPWEFVASTLGNDDRAEVARELRQRAQFEAADAKGIVPKFGQRNKGERFSMPLNLPAYETMRELVGITRDILASGDRSLLIRSGKPRVSALRARLGHGSSAAERDMVFRIHREGYQYDESHDSKLRELYKDAPWLLKGDHQ